MDTCCHDIPPPCAADEYQELSQQEEKDLEKLLTRENAIQDAAAFTEHLSEELAHLDQVWGRGECGG